MPARAAALMLAQPSMIKRPVLEYPGGILVGLQALSITRRAADPQVRANFSAPGSPGWFGLPG